MLSWVAWRGVADALESEFERRLLNVAAATAAQISPDDIADAQLLGDDGNGYATIQVQLEGLRASTGVASAALFDSARVVIYDTTGPDGAGEVTPLDSLAAADVRAALEGHPLVSRRFESAGVAHRAGLAPVASGGNVAGVIAVEAPLDYLPQLAGFGRTLFLTALLLSAAIAIFALLRIRAALASERLERQLARAQTLAAMGRLTATLAHEIKNPLAIIRGSAERLGKLEPEAQRMASFVIEESDRLSRTVARYLQFAKGAGAPAASGDAAAALNATLDLLDGEARSRRIEIVREGAEAPQPVPLDNESLKQVYLNLVLNAIEAMPDGGRVTARCRRAGGKVEVTIADHGPGFTPEQLRGPVEPFQTTKPQGSGLGLFLSRRLAESAGGELRVRNGEAGGAECTLRLPALGT